MVLSLKSRDFLKQKKKSRPFRSGLLTLLVSENLVNKPAFGVIATKRLGNAVVRNKIKRRLKSAALLAIDQKIHAGLSFIAIPKITCLNCTFDLLPSSILECISDFYRFSGKNTIRPDALPTFCDSDQSL